MFLIYQIYLVIRVFYVRGATMRYQAILIAHDHFVDWLET